MASLTKVIPTSSLALRLIEEGRLGLRDDIANYLPDYESRGDKVTVWNLLTHTVYYEFGHPLSAISHQPPEKILKAIYSTPARTTSGKLNYTNSSSILLGLIVEKFFGQSLANVSEEVFFKPLGMDRTGFEPLKFTNKYQVVPTEVHPSRGLIHGDVHDESAFGLLPQPSGTAGLFTTVPDLLKFAKMLLNGGELGGRKYFRAETIKRMASDQTSGSEVTGLGWELGQPRFMGKYAKGTFGKTGFTGCLILINLNLDSAVVILSSHIYPKRPPSFEAINHFRRNVADLVFGSAAAQGVQ